MGWMHSRGFMHYARKSIILCETRHNLQHHQPSVKKTSFIRVIRIYVLQSPSLSELDDKLDVIIVIALNLCKPILKYE